MENGRDCGKLFFVVMYVMGSLKVFRGTFPSQIATISKVENAEKRKKDKVARRVRESGEAQRALLGRADSSLHLKEENNATRETVKRVLIAREKSSHPHNNQKKKKIAPKEILLLPAPDLYLL